MEVGLNAQRNKALAKLGLGIGVPPPGLRATTCATARVGSVHASRHVAHAPPSVPAGDAKEKHPGMKLLEPWFTDPKMEEEYRDAAYTLQVVGTRMRRGC